MPFASGNKKTANVTDSRVAASDQAIVLREGGLLFAPQSPLPNSSAATVAQKTDWTLLAIIGGGVAALLVVIWLFKK